MRGGARHAQQDPPKPLPPPSQTILPPSIDTQAIICIMKLLILALCLTAAAAAPVPAHYKPAATLCADRQCLCYASRWNTPVDCATCQCKVCHAWWCTNVRSRVADRPARGFPARGTLPCHGTGRRAIDRRRVGATAACPGSRRRHRCRKPGLTPSHLICSLHPGLRRPQPRPCGGVQHHPPACRPLLLQRHCQGLRAVSATGGGSRACYGAGTHPACCVADPWTRASSLISPQSAPLPSNSCAAQNCDINGCNSLGKCNRCAEGFGRDATGACVVVSKQPLRPGAPGRSRGLV